VAKNSKIVWKGIPGLRSRLVPIDSVQPHPENPRRGNLDVIEDSLRQFGQQKAILISKRTGNIVAGNHTWRTAAERMGWTHIARDLSDLDPDAERRYLLVDNRASDLGEYDEEARTALLRDLVELPAGLAGTGYSEADVAIIVDAYDRAQAALEPPTEFPEPDPSTEHECPKCHYRWSGSSAP